VNIYYLPFLKTSHLFDSQQLYNEILQQFYRFDYFFCWDSDLVCRSFSKRCFIIIKIFYRLIIFNSILILSRNNRHLGWGFSCFIIGFITIFQILLKFRLVFGWRIIICHVGREFSFSFRLIRFCFLWWFIFLLIMDQALHLHLPFLWC
jgi:hypothetical protein